MSSAEHHSQIVLRQLKSLYSILTSERVPLELDGINLQIPHVVAIARHRCKLQLSQEAYATVEKSLQSFRSSLGGGDIIYGVNTGFGGTADVRNKETDQLQRVLIRELHYGITHKTTRDPKAAAQDSPTKWALSREQVAGANELAETWTRASIVIRLNSLLKGHSAVRHVVLDRLVDLLTHDIIPVIPLRGTISASGDLSPLSYIAGAIQGKPTIRLHATSSSDPTFADMAFTRANLSPVTLEAKEGLAIVNGTAVSAATAALVLHDAHILAIFSQLLTAMTVEALLGTPESFDPFFAAIRPHPGQIDSAKNIRTWLTSSSLIQDNSGADSALRQDRYSIRTAPQWIGPVLEDLTLANQQISIECNSATDNPLVTPDARILHGGNFQAKAVTSAMEKTRQGMYTLGRMLFSQCAEMINPATSRGLPPNLVAEDPSKSYIFKGTDINMAALQAELGFLSTPVNHVQTAELGNQSLNSLALVSARYTGTSCDVLSQMCAVHAVAVCQAVDLRALVGEYFAQVRGDFEAKVQGFYAGVEGGSGVFTTKDALSQNLWKQLQKSFDVTVSLNAEDRFTAIARSLQLTLLENEELRALNASLKSIDTLCKEIAEVLERQWFVTRDAYLQHGDATHLLGSGSKKLYTFVRKTLAIPMLYSGKLQTPKLDGEEGEAPTVGTFNTRMYEAIRDGSVLEVVISALEEAGSAA
ncbi:phenylalanine ammonia-lyase [Periconia macrospinosa]|uniref:Phenylalanine ammonia-lyase n=1 Tax=Periconia macrospinosa TaxID=97972 RepID=A0A2V1DWM3_9PLEO|nr:phenylalanine ammonia-lyase [Periconia macrospinosa]